MWKNIFLCKVESQQCGGGGGGREEEIWCVSRKTVGETQT